MTEQTYSTMRNAEMSQFGMQALWRLAMWVGLATFALFAAVLSVYSNAGAQRQTPSVTSGQAAKQTRVDAVESGAQPNETAEETRRLAEAVHALAVDRDQLVTRMAALERNLDGVTGTIKRDRTSTPLPSQVQNPPLPQLQAQAQIPAQAQVQDLPQIQVQTQPQSQIQAQAQTPQPNPGPATVAAPRPETTPAPATEVAVSPAPPPISRQIATAGDAAQTATPDAGARAAPSPPGLASLAPPREALTGGNELGVDVGGATNYEGLRALWHATKNNDPELLADLYPMVTVRENGKTHGVELRLVIGPIADPEAASRLCTTLSDAHHYCQPVAFEGQRLAVTDTAPIKSTPLPPGAPHHPAPAHASSHLDEIPSVVKLTPSSNYPHGK